MSRTLAVAGKEIKTYFSTPVAYVVFGVFSLITGYFFLQILHYFFKIQMSMMQMQNPMLMERLNLNDAVVRPLFLNVDVFFLLMLPILTMRLVAEEKKTGTFELLMTLPVRPVEVVAGKYLASLVVLAAMILIATTFPLVLSIIGEGGLDWQTILVTLLGMFLLGGSFLAISLFASSVTSSQVVAGMLGFGILLLFWVVGWAAQDATGIWKDVLENMSVLQHFESFTKGLLGIHHVVFFLSLAFLGLFLTHRMVESQRWR